MHNCGSENPDPAVGEKSWNGPQRIDAQESEIAGTAERCDKPTQVNKSDPIIGLHQVLQRCVIYRCSVPGCIPFSGIAHN